MKTLTPLNAALLAYNQAVLEQTAGIVAQHPQFSSAYSAHIGPHVRHIIEHYQALCRGLQVASPSAAQEAEVCVDYDSRARDPRIENNPAFALASLRELQQWLAPEHWADTQLSQGLAIHLRGGLQGEHQFVTPSTVARELTFLASHAVHHFAVLQGYARQEGKTFGAGLGRAPATIAHETQAPANPQPLSMAATA
jgi:hypothetical protein